MKRKRFASQTCVLCWVFSALSNYRAFLGPLFAWTAAMSKFEYRPLPKMVSLLLAFSASRWQAAALRPRFFALMQEQKVQKFGLVVGPWIILTCGSAAGLPNA